MRLSVFIFFTDTVKIGPAAFPGPGEDSELGEELYDTGKTVLSEACTLRHFGSREWFSKVIWHKRQIIPGALENQFLCNSGRNPVKAM